MFQYFYLLTGAFRCHFGPHNPHLSRGFGFAVGSRKRMGSCLGRSSHNHRFCQPFLFKDWFLILGWEKPWPVLWKMLGEIQGSHPRFRRSLGTFKNALLPSTAGNLESAEQLKHNKNRSGSMCFCFIPDGTIRKSSKFMMCYIHHARQVIKFFDRLCHSLSSQAHVCGAVLVAQETKRHCLNMCHGNPLTLPRGGDSHLETLAVWPNW